MSSKLFSPFLTSGFDHPYHLELLVLRLSGLCFHFVVFCIKFLYKNSVTPVQKTVFSRL